MIASKILLWVQYQRKLMYEEAAACENKDVEWVKSAHLTASLLPKLKSDSAILPTSRLTCKIFRRRSDSEIFTFPAFDTWHSTKLCVWLQAFLNAESDPAHFTKVCIWRELLAFFGCDAVILPSWRLPQRKVLYASDGVEIAFFASDTNFFAISPFNLII